MADKELAEVQRHIETINDEMGRVQVDIAVMKNDMKWIKKITPINTVILILTLLGIVASIFLV